MRKSLLNNERGEVIPGATLRTDAWWIEPLMVVLVLGGFGVYATWAALQNANYYAAPYLSPFYSPCLATNCAARHAAAGRLLVEPVAGVPDPLDPARLPRHLLLLPQGVLPLVLLVAAGLRRAATRRKSYSGETRFPFILQNLHRYFFWLSLLVLALPLVGRAPRVRLPRAASASGVGTLVLIVNATLLSLYTLSLPLLPAPRAAATSTRFQSAPLRLPPLAARPTA